MAYRVGEPQRIGNRKQEPGTPRGRHKNARTHVTVMDDVMDDADTLDERTPDTTPLEMRSKADFIRYNGADDEDTAPDEEAELYADYLDFKRHLADYEKKRSRHTKRSLRYSPKSRQRLPQIMLKKREV
jgi:hypothetical protein